MIGVVDYGMGNIKSMVNAIEYLGYDAVVTNEQKILDGCSHIILPGVGAFGDAIDNLRKKSVIPILEELVLEKRKPFLGVCIGMQLLAKSSDEHGLHSGLGWIDGEVKAFKMLPGLKVPHVGWNDVKITKPHPVFKDFRPEYLTFYFVHSFHMVCRNEADVAATCTYGENFPAAVIKDNIVATQFHPEKSQDNGLLFLKNYLTWGDRFDG